MRNFLIAIITIATVGNVFANSVTVKWIPKKILTVDEAKKTPLSGYLWITESDGYNADIQVGTETEPARGSNNSNKGGEEFGTKNYFDNETDLGLKKKFGTVLFKDLPDDPEEKDKIIEFNETGAIVKVEFTIYVDQPGAGGDRDTWEYNPFPTVDVGHTWWKFSILPNNSAELEEIITDTSLHEYINKTAGYYPTTEVRPGSSSSPGKLKTPDNSHEINSSQIFSISTFDKFIKGLNYTKNLDNSPGTYNLNTNNCTDAGINAGTLVGVAIKDTQGEWLGGGGSNPGDLGEDLREMK